MDLRGSDRIPSDSQGPLTPLRAPDVMPRTRPAPPRGAPAAVRTAATEQGGR
jgi:hypothetical protein